MDANQLQELIDVLHSMVRALDENTAALKAGGGAGGARPRKAGKKEGKTKWEAVEVRARAKKWPNEYGWYKAKLGGVRIAEWFDTKSATMAAILEEAQECQLTVTITFDEWVNNGFTNRMLKTVELGEPLSAVGSAKKAEEKPEPEEVEEEAAEEAPW